MNYKLEKRNGQLVDFNAEKIKTAILKAMADVNQIDTFIADYIAVELLTRFVNHSERGDSITVEMVQNAIEDMLMAVGKRDVAKAYILYRNERAEKRKRGWDMDDLQRSIWERKYRHNNESFDQWLHRVSNGNEKLMKIIRDKKFIFAGRILANRGLHKEGRKITYSNCYVIPQVEDSIESIYDTASKLARTYSYSGGCGLDISKLRPNGSPVNNASKSTSGAVSFCKLFDLTTSLIGMNGRRGALMLSIVDTHPDLVEFIEMKTKEGEVTSANISVRMSDNFMNAVESSAKWKLSWSDDEGRHASKIVDANEVFELLCRNNFNWAEPGILFWDRIEKWHMMSEHPEHEFAGTNPCRW